jgi:putative spermidine/putrescine transport system ATP-binding protein
VPPGPVDVLVRPENLRIAAIAGGNGIVTSRTFLGSVSRIGVRLSGDVVAQVDVPSASATQLLPGASVQVSLDGSPVQVAERTGNPG